MTVRRAAVVLAAACLFLGAADRRPGQVAAPAAPQAYAGRREGGAGSAAEGKSHLKRANALAGEGDCEAAIEEYTKAYELLDDPVVLFNRGECYRRTGDGENAVEDYREFLEKVPSAPNRADIEAKILALDAPRAGGAHVGWRRKNATAVEARRDAGAEGGRDAGSAAARGSIRDQPRYQA